MTGVQTCALPIYRAVIMWQPGAMFTIGASVNAPPSMLYCTVKPATALTVGKPKLAAQVFINGSNTGALGKITTLTVLLGPHSPLPAVPAKVAPQSAAST